MSLKVMLEIVNDVGPVKVLIGSILGVMGAIVTIREFHRISVDFFKGFSNTYKDWNGYWSGLHVTASIDKVTGKPIKSWHIYNLTFDYKGNISGSLVDSLTKDVKFETTGKVYGNYWVLRHISQRTPTIPIVEIYKSLDGKTVGTLSTFSWGKDHFAFSSPIVIKKMKSKDDPNIVSEEEYMRLVKKEPIMYAGGKAPNKKMLKKTEK